MDANPSTLDLQLLSLAEVASILGVSRTTVWRMAQDADPSMRMPVIRIGSRRLVPRQWLIAKVSQRDSDAASVTASVDPPIGAR